MSEMDALPTAKIAVEEYGDGAEAEINRRAEMALLEGDYKAFGVWREVIVFVSDLQSKSARPTK